MWTLRDRSHEFSNYGTPQYNTTHYTIRASPREGHLSLFRYNTLATKKKKKKMKGVMRSSIFFGNINKGEFGIRQ